MKTRERVFRNSDPEGKIGVEYTATPATDKQMDFIKSLLSERKLTVEQRENANEHLAGGLNKNQASKWIERLLELPKVEKAPKAEIVDVPAGRYAVTGEDGTTDFYKVDRPTEGRWAGYTFAKLLVANGGFGDDLSEQRLPFPQTKAVLAKIQDSGIQESMERYGKELGKCGHCGRTLTDNTSIERGIGPVCAQKMGWS